MKEGAGPDIQFVQDDDKETITNTLSAGEYAKDDIMLIDRNMQVLEYWDASNSNLGPGSTIITTLDMIKMGKYTKTCSAAPSKPAVEKPKVDPSKPKVNPAAKQTCHMKLGAKARGGKKKRIGKVEDACTCHDRCCDLTDMKSITYMFKLPKAPKTTNKKAKARKGTCWCYPGVAKGKKAGKALYMKKTDKNFISGEVKKQ